MLQFIIKVVSFPVWETCDASGSQTGTRHEFQTEDPRTGWWANAEKVAFIRQMLGELRAVADAEGAEMLRYLLEMAYLEAGDILTGLRPLSINGEGNEPAGIPAEPAGKVKF